MAASPGNALDGNGKGTDSRRMVAMWEVSTEDVAEAAVVAADSRSTHSPLAGPWLATYTVLVVLNAEHVQPPKGIRI